MVRQKDFPHPIAEVTKKASNSFDQERLEHPVSPTYPALAPPSFHCRPGSSIMIDSQFKGPWIGKQAHGTWNLPKEADERTFFAQWPALTVDWCNVARLTIDVLPEVALLETFDFYM
jgi:hypothetical protein